MIVDIADLSGNIKKFAYLWMVQMLYFLSSQALFTKLSKEENMLPERCLHWSCVILGAIIQMYFIAMLILYLLT